MGSSEADVIIEDERSQVEGVVGLPTLQKMTLCMVRTTIRMLSIAVPSTEPRSLTDFMKVLERGEKLEKRIL